MSGEFQHVDYRAPTHREEREQSRYDKCFYVIDVAAIRQPCNHWRESHPVESIYNHDGHEFVEAPAG